MTFAWAGPRLTWLVDVELVTNNLDEIEGGAVIVTGLAVTRAWLVSRVNSIAASEVLSGASAVLLSGSGLVSEMAEVKELSELASGVSVGEEVSLRVSETTVVGELSEFVSEVLVLEELSVLVPEVSVFEELSEPLESAWSEEPPEISTVSSSIGCSAGGGVTGSCSSRRRLAASCLCFRKLKILDRTLPTENAMMFSPTLMTEESQETRQYIKY